MISKSLRTGLLMLLFVVTSFAAVDGPPASTALVPAQQRKSAPNFNLTDVSGKIATLTSYKGRILVLDFWATWCTGCKQEIPWFTEYRSRYGTQGLSIVGVAMDDGGWKVVKPFLRTHPIPYRMVLGNDATVRKYGIENLPDTFLIDRYGRVAAAYRARLVDRDELEASIKKLLSEK
jgi:cytochrome c biogenesis protein CcmG/thiol:disulfide interchange protein DsbE